MTPYLQRDSSRHAPELWGPGEPGRQTASPPSSALGNLLPNVFWGVGELPPINFGQTRFALEGEELVWMPGGELGL